MTVHLDVSQLVFDPRRTGIQRAERELIRHWPGPAPLIPCCFNPATGDLHELPGSLLEALCADAPEGGMPEEVRRLAPHAVPGRPVRREGMRLLSAELFQDPARAAFYHALDAPGVHWLVYDFLPWLHPDWFGPGAVRPLMPYLRALRSVPNLAFISQQTRDHYARRIARAPQDGPVIPLGGDGLDLGKQPFAPESRNFVLLGTIEPRKNAVPVMRAFQRLWQEGADAGLLVIGALPPEAPAEIALVQELHAYPRFQHLEHVSDAVLREALTHARALLFPSEGEGFGIPPMEALHAGIPVVVSARLPALDGLPDLGQIRLDPVSVDSIAAAVRRLLDDAEARRLHEEAAGMPVAGWRDFAAAAAAWVQQSQSATAGGSPRQA